MGHRLAILAVVLLAAGWAVTGPLSVARHASETPFRVDYLAYDAAATIIRRGDAPSLYDPQLQHDVEVERSGNDERAYLVYLNPPIVGAAFVPLSWLDARPAYVLTVVVMTVVMAAAAWIIYELAEEIPRRTRLIMVACIVGSTTVASALMSGQLTPLLLLIGALAMWAHRKGRPWLAGGLLGLLAIKPHFAVAVLILLLIARQRRLAAGIVAVAAVCAAASLAIVGLDGARDYVEILQRSFERPASLYIDVRSEQNASGLIALLFQVYRGPVVTVTNAVIAVLALALAYRAMNRASYTGRMRTHYVAALVAVVVCVTASHIQFYDLALLAFPALFIVERSVVAPAAARPRFYGVLVLTVLWLEVAGILAGAKMSVSAVPLLLFTLMILDWPRFERWVIGVDAAPAEQAPLTPAEARAA